MKNLQNKMVLKGLLRFLLATFFCLVLMIFWVVFHDKARILNDLVFGLCFLLILGLVFGDYGLKVSETMKNQVKFHGENDCKNLGIKIGFVGAIPSYIGVIALFLAKLQIVKAPLWLYAVFNVYFYPIFDLFLTNAEYQTINEHNVLILSSIPLYSFIVLIILPLVMPLGCQIGYSIGYNNIDIKAKLFYKNKKNI